jgi:hypothetical protein
MVSPSILKPLYLLFVGTVLGISEFTTLTYSAHQPRALDFGGILKPLLKKTPSSFRPKNMSGRS